jgi:dihydroneopterin aldolase
LLVKKQHHELIEDLAENIFEIIFQNRLVKKTNIKIEKLDIIKNSESVGIEFSKSKI